MKSSKLIKLMVKGISEFSDCDTVEVSGAEPHCTGCVFKGRCPGSMVECLPYERKDRRKVRFVKKPDVI